MKKKGNKRGKGFVGKNAFSGKAERRAARRAGSTIVPSYQKVLHSVTVKDDKPSFRSGIRISTTTVVGPKGEKMLRVDKISCLRYDQLPKEYLSSGLNVFAMHGQQALFALYFTDGVMVRGNIIMLEIGQLISPSDFDFCLEMCKEAGERLAAINLKRKEQRAYEQDLLDWAGVENEVVI